MARLFTESQAKEQMCCTKDRHCQASKCMAWRWHHKISYTGGNRWLPPKPVLGPQTEYGYCGRVS